MHPSVTIPTLSEAKELVDTRLKDYTRARMVAAQHLHERYGALWGSIDTLVNSGGKRFRPYMLILAYSAYAPEESNLEDILPAALAQELLHQAMLVHDDIIDRDTIRYGIPNMTGSYLSIYEPLLPSTGERRHMAEGAALLAGDALLSDAYRLLSTSPVAPEALQKATLLFSQGVFTVIGGELLDTENAFLGEYTVSAETVALLKTAAYSFEAPLTIGAALAGADEVEIGLLRQFSDQLGAAYQYQDDLLGVFGDSSVTGKSTETDLLEGKRTLLIEQFEQLASAEQKQAFAGLFHNQELTSDDCHAARQLLTESGAKAKVQATIAELELAAEHTINALSMPENAKQEFRGLIQFCLKRDS